MKFARIAEGLDELDERRLRTGYHGAAGLLEQARGDTAKLTQPGAPPRKDRAQPPRHGEQDAWASRDPVLGLRQLERLARSLEREHPGAANSLREGLPETLTVQRLGIDGALARTLRTTNPIENMNGTVAHHTRNVKRWRDGQMLLRWIGAALHEAQRGFRRVRGHRDLAKLCAVLERHRKPHVLPAERKVA